MSINLYLIFERKLRSRSVSIFIQGHLVMLNTSAGTGATQTPGNAIIGDIASSASLSQPPS